MGESCGEALKLRLWTWGPPSLTFYLWVEREQVEATYENQTVRTSKSETDTALNLSLKVTAKRMLSPRTHAKVGLPPSRILVPWPADPAASVLLYLSKVLLLVGPGV